MIIPLNSSTLPALQLWSFAFILTYSYFKYRCTAFDQDAYKQAVTFQSNMPDQYQAFCFRGGVRKNIYHNGV